MSLPATARAGKSCGAAGAGERFLTGLRTGQIRDLMDVMAHVVLTADGAATYLPLALRSTEPNTWRGCLRACTTCRRRSRQRACGSTPGGEPAEADPAGSSSRTRKIAPQRLTHGRR